MAAQTSCFPDHGGQRSFPSTEAPSQSSDLIILMTKKLRMLGKRSLKSSIYKVPNKLRKVDEEAYSPRIVSIGPFHASTTEKHDHLLAMEEHKSWYMLYLFNRTTDQKEILVKCSEAILNLEQKIRRRYTENIKLESQELAQITLVDGCFILELFLRSWFGDSTPEDPIFQNAWMVPNLRHDLALLENQIPFFVLEELFHVVVRHFPKHLPCSITDLVLSFFNPGLNLNQEAIRMKCSQDGSYSHILDLLHDFYLPTFPETDPEGEETWGFSKCATKLLEAGIVFEKGKEAHLSLDISFNKVTGVITIPPFHLDEITKSLVRNLISFEQCFGSAEQHITSYAKLLESLIQSSPDVELLHKKQIITNDLSEIEDVLKFFRNISREVAPNDFNFGTLCKEVNEYQKSWRSRHRLMAFLNVRCRSYMAVLKSNYFSNPWTFISFMAAAVLLTLTIVQTYYAVRSYQHSH